MCRRDISSYLSRQLLLCVFVNKYFCLEKLVSVRSFSVGLFRSVQVKNPRLFLICSIDVRERERGATDSILLRRVVFMRLSMVRSSMLGNLLYDWWTVGARREHIFTLFDVAQGGSNEHRVVYVYSVSVERTWTPPGMRLKYLRKYLHWWRKWIHLVLYSLESSSLVCKIN